MTSMPTAANLDLDQELAMPGGTVTVLIARSRGVVEIYSQPEPDQLDWELACGLLHRMNVTHVGQPSFWKGVDHWVVHRPGDTPDR